MGVRGLFRYIQSIRRPGKLLPQKGLRIGIDAFCLLYLFKEKQDNFIEYIDYLLSLEYSLTFIMDKRASKEKSVVVEQRKEARAEAKSEAKELEEFLSTKHLEPKEKENLTQLLERYQQKGWQLTNEHTEWFLTMLASKEVTLQWAEEEADPLLARGPFDCVISSDSDMLILGCPCLLVPKKNKKGAIEHDVYSYTDVLTFLSLKPQQLYELAFLAGCDIQPTPITDIETAAAWLRFYGSLETISKKKNDILKNEHIELYKHLYDTNWKI
jgi:5'-3' exonuclease